jgi:hypothetical protein
MHSGIKLRCQDAKRKTQFLVTEEEIPVPGWSMYYSEHYPNPNAASKTLEEAAAPDSVAKSEAKRQRLLSPSRTNRRSERISDQIPLSQDPGWLQDDEDFYDGDWGHLPNNATAQAFVMPDLPRTKYGRDGVFDENNSNRSRSRNSGSHELQFFSCRDDSAGSTGGRPALPTKPGYNDNNNSKNRVGSSSKEDRDGESFQEDEFVGKYDLCGTEVNQDTVIMLWAPEDVRKVHPQRLCRAVLQHRARAALRKMKTIAHQSSQEATIDTAYFAYPTLPASSPPPASESEDDEDEDEDEGSALDNQQDTCDQTNITPLPPRPVAASVSTAPTVLTTGGRRSSSRHSQAASSHAHGAGTGGHGNTHIDALVSTSTDAPSPARNSLRKQQQTASGAPPQLSQRSSEAASAMLGLGFGDGAPLSAATGAATGAATAGAAQKGNSAADGAGGVAASASKRASSKRLFEASPSVSSSSAASSSKKSGPRATKKAAAATDVASITPAATKEKASPLSSSKLVPSSRLNIPPMDASEPVVIAVTGFRGSSMTEEDEDVPDFVQLLCEHYGRGVYEMPSKSGKRAKSATNRKSSSSSRSSRTSTAIDMTCVETETKGDDDNEGNFAATMIVAHSSGSVRTVRILFALARGLPIVSERWVYDSIERQYVVEWFAFRVERYKHLPLYTQSNVLARNRIFIGNNSKVSESVQKKLYELAGAAVVGDIRACNLAIFGTERDYYMWAKGRTQHFQQLVSTGALSEPRMQEALEAERAYAVSLSERRQLGLFLLVADSLEKGELIGDADRKDAHLITFSHAQIAKKAASPPKAAPPKEKAAPTGSASSSSKQTPVTAAVAASFTASKNGAKARKAAAVESATVTVTKKGASSSSAKKPSVAVVPAAASEKKSTAVKRKLPPSDSSSSSSSSSGAANAVTVEKKARPQPAPRRRSFRACAGKACGPGYTCSRHRAEYKLVFVPDQQVDPLDQAKRDRKRKRAESKQAAAAAAAAEKDGDGGGTADLGDDDEDAMEDGGVDCDEQEEEQEAPGTERSNSEEMMTEESKGEEKAGGLRYAPRSQQESPSRIKQTLGLIGNTVTGLMRSFSRSSDPAPVEEALSPVF